MLFYVDFESLYGCVHAVFDAGKSSFSLSFLGTHSLSMSSLGCNVLCMVISFLVLWSICLSSSLVHLRKGPEVANEWYSTSIYSFDKVSARELCLE